MRALLILKMFHNRSRRALGTGVGTDKIETFSVRERCKQRETDVKPKLAKVLVSISVQKVARNNFINSIWFCLCKYYHRHFEHEIKQTMNCVRLFFLFYFHFFLLEAHKQSSLFQLIWNHIIIAFICLFFFLNEE